MKMKKKLFIPLIAALLTIGLTSVGFAAWVIVGDKQVTTDDKAQFTAYEVSDQTIDFDVSFGGAAIKFAGDGSDPSPNYAWLQFDGGDSANLTTTLTITINNYSKIKGRTITFEFGDLSVTAASGNKLAENWNTQYVVPPTLAKVVISGGKVTSGTATLGTEADGKITLTIPYTFTWGSAFGTQNPFDYYNSKNPADNANSGIKDEASAALAALNTLNGATYEITVTGKTQ